jgi:renalase
MKTDVIILGAGLSGLSARKTLIEAGISTLTLEKGRGVGGRTSVRRGEGWIADLGAQFCTSHGVAWQAILESQTHDILKLDVNDGPGMAIQTQRLVHKKGMNAFAKFLAQIEPATHSILCSHKVTNLSLSSSEKRNWTVMTDCKQSFEAQALLITAPIPQALELFKNSGFDMTENCANQLASVKFAPCLSMIIELEDQSLKLPVSLWKNPTKDISGIFDQNAKGHASAKNIWVVHASAQFSQEIWEKSDAEISAELLSKTAEALKVQYSKIQQSKAILHKWRYSEAVQTVAEPFLELHFAHQNDVPKVYMAGDAFLRSSVEGAFSSGLAAAKQMVSFFSSRSQ